MTLIIGVRCKDGCLVISDYRNRIDTNGIITYEDNFEKTMMHNNYIIYNHGYNRIEDKDWKIRDKDLTPDSNNPIYQQILDEMKNKSDKGAFYVFINKDELHEVSIIVGQGVSYKNHLSDNTIISGTGGKYVDSKLLINLQGQKCKKVKDKLKKTFNNAYDLMKFMSINKDEFSQKSCIKHLLAE